MGWKFWESRKIKCPVNLVGKYVRKLNEDTGDREMFFEKTGKRRYDVVSKVILSPKNSNHNIFGTGLAGMGKSALFEVLLNEVTSPIECAKYGIEPMDAVIFSPKHFDDEEVIDFDLGRFRVVDCSKEMINPFEDVLAVKSSVEVMVANLVKTPGIMASHIGSLAGKVVEFAPCKDWDDFDRNLKGLRKQRNNEFNDSELNYLQDKIHFLKIKATIKDIPTTNCLFYLGGLQSDEARAFYYELYLQKLVRELKFSNTKTRPILLLDEGHIVVREYGIMKTILREMRTRVSAVWCVSQSLDDVPPNLLQFAYYPSFLNHNSKPFEQKPTLRDCIQILDNRNFIDWAYQGRDNIPVFSVDEEYVMKLKMIKQEALQKRILEKENVYVPESQEDNDIVNDRKNTWTPHDDASAKTENTKFDSKETEQNILDVVEASQTGLFISQVIDQVGFPRREDGKDSKRGTTHRLIKTMTKNGKLRIKDYISADKREHKLVFDKKNPERAESQVHRKMRADMKNLLDENKIPYTEGVINQGYDLSIEKENVVLEAESGLKHSIDEWNDKILKSEKLVITILCNEEDRQLYSKLSCVGAGKTKLVLLSELLETLRNLKN